MFSRKDAKFAKEEYLTADCVRSQSVITTHLICVNLRLSAVTNSLLRLLFPLAERHHILLIYPDSLGGRDRGQH